MDVKDQEFLESRHKQFKLEENVARVDELAALLDEGERCNRELIAGAYNIDSLATEVAREHAQVLNEFEQKRQTSEDLKARLEGQQKFS
jgi:hypothetical protein